MTNFQVQNKSYPIVRLKCEGSQCKHSFEALEMDPDLVDVDSGRIVNEELDYPEFYCPQLWSRSEPSQSDVVRTGPCS